MIAVALTDRRLKINGNITHLSSLREYQSSTDVSVVIVMLMFYVSGINSDSDRKENRFFIILN